MRKSGVMIILLLFQLQALFGFENAEAPFKNPLLPIEERIDDLLGRMTLDEKIGQMNQVSYFTVDDRALAQYSDDDLDAFIMRMGAAGGHGQKKLGQMSKKEKLSVVREAHLKILDDKILSPVEVGNIGSILNIVDTEMINNLQKIAVERSRLGIPLIIGRDVIHGFKTIFPIPLGQAASFDPEIVRHTARIAAKEARSVGVTWTFAPMLDISRDPRWGRIAESLGEDPYLAGVMGSAMVKGFQGDGNLSDPDALAACAKHFIGYGAAEGGRDYNSTYIPPYLMRNVYLPPFYSSVKAGAATIMTSFNDNDGIPATANKYLLRNILRDEWGFDGFVVSDWTSVSEMIQHGYASNKKCAAELAVKAGVDMDMVSESFIDNLKSLINKGKVAQKTIDDAVRNILRVKFRLGLFENPYTDISKCSFYDQTHLESARKLASRSAILLKNDDRLLPLSENLKIAVIGPMADAPHDQLGTWVFDGEKEHTVTPVKALKTEYGNIKYIYEPTLAYSRDKSTANFEKAKSAAVASDVAVVFLGEESILSGEAHSLSNINLIGVQSDLLKAVKSTGKPVVMVVMAGRPLTIERDLPYADAVIYNFHPGTMGGPAIWDLIFGRVNPSGKLPVTFVREVGQIPYYYNYNNTGRPSPDTVMTLDQIPLEAGQTSLGNTSFYLDSGRKPLFPFGYGMSYSEFEYSNIRVSDETLKPEGEITVTADLKNNSRIDGTDVVQLYIQDVVASVIRPIKELKGFKRVHVKGGNVQEVSFCITSADLEFYGSDMVKKAESGEFRVWIGGSSDTSLMTTFELME